MSARDGGAGFRLVRVSVQAARPAPHSLVDAAEIAGIHPEILRHYCRLGLFGEARARAAGDPTFDDDALYELRRFEHHRRRLGMSRKTLRLVVELWRELEHLRGEVRFLRGR